MEMFEWHINSSTRARSKQASTHTPSQCTRPFCCSNSPVKTRFAKLVPQRGAHPESGDALAARTEACLGPSQMQWHHRRRRVGHVIQCQCVGATSRHSCLCHSRWTIELSCQADYYHCRPGSITTAQANRAIIAWASLPFARWTKTLDSLVIHQQSCHRNATKLVSNSCFVVPGRLNGSTWHEIAANLYLHFNLLRQQGRLGPRKWTIAGAPSVGMAGRIALYGCTHGA